MFNWIFKANKNADNSELVLDKENITSIFLLPEVQIDGGVKLVRNGIGTRKRFGVPIYNIAIYLPLKTQDATGAIEMPGAKQVRMVALRDISGDTLASAFLNGIKQNSSIESQNLYRTQLGAIIKTFRSKENISAGQTFHVDLLPNRGTFFYINEELKGVAEYVDGYNEAVLRIWLGDKPADNNLKAALLSA